MIYTRPRYDRAWRKLTSSQQAAVNAAVVRLEAAFGRPHGHSGLGLRAFGRYFEFRAGLGLRVCFCVTVAASFFALSEAMNKFARL